MIRSTKTSIKFTNLGKLSQLHEVIDEYRNVLSSFVDLLWDEEKVPTLLPKEISKKVDTWLSVRMIQCAGKQASGIVRGTRQKQKQRLFVIGKLNNGGKFKQARKLQTFYDKTIMSKPKINEVEPELDERFVKMDFENSTSFDGWITLASIGRKNKIIIPFKKTRHFNKMESKGVLNKGIRLSKKNLTFMFEIEEPPKKIIGSVLGIDIGQTTTISCSNGFSSTPNKHGHTMASINKVMCRKKKDSNGFKRTQAHRKNYVNWSINQLNLTNVRQINIESIKHLRKNKRSSKALSHWTYTEIFDKLNSCCIEQGVLVNKVNPTYTSQRCSVCGWTRKSNRKGKSFKCGSCGFAADSDLNASNNIALPLIGITKKQRLRQENKTGFYWNVEGQERIVPVVKKV